jgi:hypothetical protein
LGIWKVKRGKRPLNVSHESIEKHTHKHSLKREQIEEQEEDHFQKRVA